MNTDERRWIHVKAAAGVLRDMTLRGCVAAILCSSVMLAGCGTAVPKACSPLPDGRERPVLVAPMRSGIELDGDLSDWKGIAFRSVTPAGGVFDADTTPTDSPADLSFRFAVCHDAEALYVAVEVTDDVIVADSCQPGAISAPAWDDDAIEVFLDGNHNHAPDSRVKGGDELRYGGEFSLIANGAAMSDYSGYPKSFGSLWQGAVNSARQATEGKARYEFRFPWGVMGSSTRTRSTIGFNICAQDDDDGRRRDSALYFLGTPKRPFLDERFFADLYLAP